MDPSAIIAAALSGGATATASELASAAVRDAYSRFRAVLIARLGDRRPAERLLEDIEREPEKSDILVLQIIRDDPDVINEVYQLAVRLLDALQESDASPVKYRVEVTRAAGVQIGSHNTQVNTFSVGEARVGGD
ncbi:hypothetical protein [Actinomadura sp. DC4]|uniref:hypothetical protein n=1 Tax=Actinomadura sp. DC4 TaxID=3055069 RepID=UPI0025B16879|nr:hypothetical protein [Actinomadura sp. DC4]MDN3356828.1 hypothetical protein [Actinomadura sp. DC4]